MFGREIVYVLGLLYVLELRAKFQIQDSGYVEEDVMKVLVTGGSGRIGRFVVAGLQERHHEVTVFDIKQSDESTAGDRLCGCQP